MAVEIEFRDGIAAVPNHVAWMMRGLETHTMTKDEAIAAAETQMTRNYLNQVQRKVIRGHFRENRF